jgi:hypothetical protein
MANPMSRQIAGALHEQPAPVEIQQAAGEVTAQLRLPARYRSDRPT